MVSCSLCREIANESGNGDRYLGGSWHTAVATLDESWFFISQATGVYLCEPGGSALPPPDHSYGQLHRSFWGGVSRCRGRGVGFKLRWCFVELNAGRQTPTEPVRKQQRQSTKLANIYKSQLKQRILRERNNCTHDEKTISQGHRQNSPTRNPEPEAIRDWNASSFSADQAVTLQMRGAERFFGRGGIGPRGQCQAWFAICGLAKQ